MSWSQLRSILWLRWRLSRNQWARGGAFNAVVLLIVTVIGCVLAFVGSVAGVGVGLFVPGKAEPRTILLVWDGICGAFLFFWLLGIVTEIQRSESIDLSRLLHLPVSLNGVFLLNYVASHFTVSLIIFLPAMLGLSIGLIFGSDWRMVLLPPLVLGFVFMITAWTYCLRGWLIALMVNPRRRRTVIMVVTMTTIILSQLPNLYINVLHRWVVPGGNRPFAAPVNPNWPADFFSAFLSAHNYIPLLWVGKGAGALAEKEIWPAVFGMVGAFTIGALGLKRAYSATLRFYQGQASGKPIRPVRPRPVVARPGRTFLERRVPGLPEEAGALALAFFRSMMRAPEVKMALGSNLLVLVLLGGTSLIGKRGTLNETAKLFISTGAVALPLFGLAQLMFNQFGLDREGFRAFVLLPVQRKYVLLGKNCALLPVALGTGLPILALAAFLMRLPPAAFIAACFQLVTMFCLLSAVGNVVSTLVPYRIAIGSLKPTKAPAMKMLLVFLMHLLFPIALIPTLIPVGVAVLLDKEGGLPGLWIDLGLSIIVSFAAVGIYWSTLGAVGALLQRREKDILQAVTLETE